LVGEDVLVNSSVVANNAMNRERRLAGVNSYARELGLNPLDWLRAREAIPAWLDLCCGRGRALLQAADALRRERILDRFRLMGVDLVDAFDETPDAEAVTFVTASIVTWQPPQPFDLITCVHGLHYVGDKVAVLVRAAASLTGTGLFIADFDASSIRQPDGRPLGRPFTTALRAAGLEYDARRHLIRCHGRRAIGLPHTYLGADDRAGPNYTGQPAVHSYYALG
jgi:SAM-dependent methyltransferase